jgi:hypothetical protein
MGNTADSIELQARIADLERQVDSLRRLVEGTEHRGLVPLDLQSLYWEASRMYRVRKTSKEIHLWGCLIRSLDVRQLLALGRLTHDPFPWKPFLVLLDHAAMDGYLVDEPTAHLLEIAQDLMNAQGLALLTPADVMGTPLAVVQALETLQG